IYAVERHFEIEDFDHPGVFIKDRHIGSPDLLSLNVDRLIAHRQHVGDIWRSNNGLGKRPLDANRAGFIHYYDHVLDGLSFPDKADPWRILGRNSWWQQLTRVAGSRAHIEPGLETRLGGHRFRG